MSKIAIKAENLSKAYQLGEIGTGTISRDLERWYARIRGKEDPFLRVGETNDRTSKGSSDIVWSLKDINFEIEQGDAVGIIGRNGAGKSTLLKVLSRVTSPTSGRITGKGRIASLLEVGTGFHPELTGRENIYLNGAILGMRKKEITRKFDEIVDFAGVERYIDTPVKRYSSGMYVRLAFAVAAHLESEILIVDEVLAVGDAEFQKKCLGKMGEVSKGEGRTVLFVSHNMQSVDALCNKGILMHQGCIENIAETTKIIERYINLTDIKNQQKPKYLFNKTLGIKEVSFFANGAETNDLLFEKEAKIIVVFENISVIENPVLGLTIKSKNGEIKLSINNLHYIPSQSRMNSGMFEIIFKSLPLLPGDYILDLYLGTPTEDLFIISDEITFSVQQASITLTGYPLNLKTNSFFFKNVVWKLQSISDKK